MSVIQWWLTYFFNAASEYLISTRQMSCRFIKSTNSGLFLKLLSSSDLLRRKFETLTRISATRHVRLYARRAYRSG